MLSIRLLGCADAGGDLARTAVSGVFTRDWWIFYGFGQSYLPLGAGLGIGPAWSLSVEVAFYALLPLLAAGIAALCRSRPASQRVRVALVALGLLGAAGIACSEAAR